ncbi:type 4a pilus biogenesis protein PilO [bacterium]|nr:type 4a pilus biogenesis protein PilO [bacterium]
MKRLIYYLVLVLVFGLGLLGYYKIEYPKLPREIKSLNDRILVKNEKLISAQILASQLDLVARLIDRNLAISSKDSLAQDASLPFLDDMTSLLQQHKIVLIHLEPSRRRVTRHDYVRTSYEMMIECNFKEFGKFINDVEKSDRLITLEEFTVENDLSSIETRKNRRRFDTHVFEVKLSTLTLIKHT